MAGTLRPGILLFALLLFSAFSPALRPARAATKFNILVISSFPKDLPAQRDLETGLKEALAHSNGTCNLFFEFMDVPRLGDNGFSGVFARYLATKYGQIKLDFVVGWAYDAINFIHDQPQLFPTARRIFFEFQAGHKLPLRDNERVIGVKNDFHASLQEVLRLENPRHLVVIGTTGDPSARSRLTNFKMVLAGLGPKLDTEYLLDQPLDRVAERLAALPREGTLAFYLLMFSDGRGTHLTPYAVVSRLAERSAVPIYSFWESLMGSGIVGGNLISQEVAGRQLGEAMLSMRNGKTVGDLSPMRRSYDWTAVKRWNLDQRMIPADAHIINRPENLLEKYFGLIVGGILFGILEALLILLLLLNRSKRRKIELELTRHRDRLEELVAERTNKLHDLNKTLLASEERFKTLSDAAFEGILLLENGIIFDVNKALVKMIGYSPASLIGRKSTDFIDKADVARVEANIRSQHEGTYEINLVGKDGVSFPTKIHARMFPFRERRIRVVAVRDLREQKKAEEEIRILRGILPICASCKKIRDDQGYWKQIEEYIEDHSEALFTHGMCAACEEKLYGDKEWFKRKMARKK